MSGEREPRVGAFPAVPRDSPSAAPAARGKARPGRDNGSGRRWTRRRIAAFGRMRRCTTMVPFPLDFDATFFFVRLPCARNPADRFVHVECDVLFRGDRRGIVIPSKTGEKGGPGVVFVIGRSRCMSRAVASPSVGAIRWISGGLRACEAFRVGERG